MNTDFQILRNLDGHAGGSAYMEILPGEFNGKWWSSDSVFFHEGGFEVVEALIYARAPSYDHYGNTTIDSHTCWEIIHDLDSFATALLPGATVADLKRLPVFERQHRFFENAGENIPALRQMVLELAAWLREVMAHERYITILGV